MEYSFDGCAPEVLIASMSVKNGNLTLPDGMSYRVLVLPEQQTMTPRLMQKVHQLVWDGATVIGPKPLKSPGLSGYPECDAAVRSLADEVWGDCDGRLIKEHAFGKGRVIWHGDSWKSSDSSLSGTGTPEQEQYGDFAVVREVLANAGIPPDFVSDAQIRYAHRREGGTEIYFVANPGATPVRARCAFRVEGKKPQLWDPVTAITRGLPVFESPGGRTIIAMQFEPFQSYFVVFTDTPGNGQDQPRIAAGNFPAQDTLALPPGPWSVSFDRRMGGPGVVKFRRLEDWTKRHEPGIKYYSGTAVYRTVFDAPDTGGAVSINLGDVKNLARVTLNGIDAGVAWCPPWSVDVTHALKRKGNALEIEVANLWPNRLIGDERLPPIAKYGKNGNLLSWPSWIFKKDPVLPAGRVTFATWKHFTKDSTLIPSGLLGPVRLIRERE
jgi:hypothetical protein